MVKNDDVSEVKDKQAEAPGLWAMSIEWLKAVGTDPS